MPREELETVKAVIRALLISENRPMSLRSFLMAFKDREGHEVPYRNFGFSDALSFLRYIPDAVQLSELGSDFSVTATVTDEVKHVERLVKCQRKSNYLSRRSPPLSKRAALFQPPPRQRSLLALNYNDALAQVRTNLRLLLADFLTNGISVRLLQEIYTRKFGHFINYRDFGYSTFEDFLVGMSDIMCPARNSTGALKVYRRKSVGAPSYVVPPEKPVANFTVHHTTVMHSLPSQRVHEPMQRVTRTAHRVGAPSCLVPSVKPPENFTVRHTTENHSLPCQEVREPSQQLVKTAHSGLHLQKSMSALQSLHSDMQSTGMKPQQGPYQRSPAVQSLHQDIQCTAVIPKMQELNQSRSSSLHLDIQPAGMEPLIPESCPTGPKQSSIHPDTKPGVEKAATQTSFQGGLSSLPKRSLEDYKESGTDTETLIQQEMTTRRSTEHHGSSCQVNPRLERNIKMILRKHPKGIWLSQLANIYKAMIGVDLCPADHGHNNFFNLMSGYRHMVSMTRPFPDQDFVVCLHENLRDSPLDHRALDTMHTLIRFSGQQGLTVEELLQSFERITGNSIDLEEHGLSHQALVLILVAKFDVMFETLRNGRILMKCKELHWGRAIATSSVETARPAKASEAAKATGAASENQTAQVTERASLTSTLKEMSGVGSPPLFICNNPYGRPDHLEVDKCYVVYVSEIYSIYHFYIRKKGIDASVQLEALMSQLDKMYNGPKSSAYVIEKKLVYLGMPCAAFYADNNESSDWYRALVVALDADSNTCQVLLVDYGTLAFLKKTELRFLRNEFMVLPPQALRATMDYLRPANSVGMPVSAAWTPDTNAAFAMLASNKQTFVCKVLRHWGAVHSVSLCITGPYSEAYVSDLLVDQGLALPTSQCNEIMAKILEAESFSTLQQADVPSPPPSPKSGGGATSIPVRMLYTQKLESQVVEAGPSSTAQRENLPYATPSSNVRTTLRHPPAYRILRSQDCQPLDQAEPCSQNIPSVSQTTELAQSLDKLYLKSHSNLTEVSLRKEVQKLVEEEQRPAGLCASSAVQPCAASSAQTTVQSTVQTYLYSSGKQASKPLHCPEQTVAASAVQRCSVPGREASVQPTVSSATQPQFSIQLTSKPTKVFPIIPPTLSLKPKVAESTTIRRPSQSDGEPAVSSALQPHFQASVQRTTKPAPIFFVMPHAPTRKPKMPESTTIRRYSQSGGEPAVSSSLQPHFQVSVQPGSKPTKDFPVIPPPPIEKPEMTESAKPQMTESATNQPACGAVDDDKDVMDLLQQELDGPCPGRAVKREWLMPDLCLMVVNYDGEPYVTTANVCQLLGWSADIVLEQLKAKRIQFPTLVLQRNRTNYWLFNQMASFSVPGVKAHGHLVQKVTLFPLKSVTDLLNLFGCTSLELQRAIAAVLHAFDPKSPYWHSVSDDATLHGNLEQMLLELCDERVKLRAEIQSGQVTTEKAERLSRIDGTIEWLKELIVAEGAKPPLCKELSKIR